MDVSICPVLASGNKADQSRVRLLRTNILPGILAVNLAPLRLWTGPKVFFNNKQLDDVGKVSLFKRINALESFHRGVPCILCRLVSPQLFSHCRVQFYGDRERVRHGWSSTRTLLLSLVESRNSLIDIKVFTTEHWPLRLETSSNEVAPAFLTLSQAVATGHLKSCLESLRTDKEMGASRMADFALQCLWQVLQASIESLGYNTLSHQRLTWDLAKWIAWNLIENGRPSMNAATRTALLQCLDEAWLFRRDSAVFINKIKAFALQRQNLSKQVSAHFARFIKEYIQYTTTITKRIDTSSRRLQGEPYASFERQRSTVRILTNSFGANLRGILEALRECVYTNFHIRILKSRPLCEGARLAVKLIEEATREGTISRLYIIVASDASAALLARDVDFVVIGADKISHLGHVSNKVGSLPAILSAKAIAAISDSRRVPQIIVLSSMDKVSVPGSVNFHGEENNDIEEIVSGWADGETLITTLRDNPQAQISNIYFETIHRNYIDKYISERGVTDRKAFKQQSRYIQQLGDQIFHGK